MDIAWDDLRLFLAVAESGSMSAAARALRLGQPTISRRLAQLEDALGYRLFRRGVRGAQPTAEAERLLAPARRMAEWAGEAGRVAEVGDGAPEGLVRVAVAPGVAFDFVVPFAAWFEKRQPRIRLEILSSIHYLDLGRGEADMALRMRPAQDRDLVTVATLHHRVGVFASPDYARRLPRRYTLADLDWIAWAPPYEDVPPNPQLQALIPGFKPAFSSDNYLVMWRAAEVGLGVMVLGDVRHRFARKGLLVPLRIDLGPYGESNLHLVAAKSALAIPRVRAVALALADELQRPSLKAPSRTPGRQKE